MSLGEIKEFDRKLNAVLEFNPEAIELSPSHSPRPSSSPVSFYDKHLEGSLVLKQVRAIPTLPLILNNIVEDSIRDFKAREPPYSLNGFQEAEDPPDYSSHPKDSYFVANYYRNSIMNPCKSIAARFVLYPHTSTWLSALSWDSPRAAVMGRHHFAGEDYGLRVTRSAHPPYIAMISPTLMEVLDVPTKALLHDLTAKFPDLATWEIYAATEEAESILRSMDTANTFNWDGPRTINPPHIPAISLRTPDASGMPWTSFLRPAIPEFRSSKPSSDSPRLSFAKKAKAAATVGPAKSARVKLFRRAKPKPKVQIEALSRVIPPRRFQEGPKRRYIPDANHFLQHVCVLTWLSVVISLLRSRHGPKQLFMMQRLLYFTAGILNVSAFEIGKARRYIFLMSLMLNIARTLPTGNSSLGFTLPSYKMLSSVRKRIVPRRSLWVAVKNAAMIPVVTQ